MSVAAALEAIDDQVAELVDRGQCGCGCGAKLSASRRRGTMFVSKAHYERVRRRKIEAGCKAAGQPCRLNLQLVLASTPTQNVHAGRSSAASASDRPSHPSGLQVPFRKAIAVLAVELAGVRVPRTPAAAQRVIEDALTKALPARQRQQLDAGAQDLVGEAA